MTDEIQYSWDQLPDEPDLWYGRFLQFYLPLGRARSLRRAYVDCLASQKKEARLNRADNTWTAMSTQYNWLDRARAWDQWMDSLAGPTIQDAELRIRLASLRAVETLLACLDSRTEKIKLTASVEILNRAGIVKPSEREAAHGGAVTADLLAKLATTVVRELDSWQQQLQTQEQSNTLPPSEPSSSG